MSDPHVKIVIPCANEGEWLRVTVDSILEATRYPSFEIFILANGDQRTDFSFAEKPAYRQRVRLKTVAEPLGVGRSKNEAVQPGDAAHYVFLDAHCLIQSPDWLDRAVACIEDHPQASMMQPEVLLITCPQEIQPDGRPDPAALQEEGLAYGIRWAWPYHRLGDIAVVQASRLSDHPYEEMASGGMAMFVRSETFHRLGKFDAEVSGWYPETMDYCVRAWLLGFPMMVNPSVRILHRLKREDPGYPRSWQNIVHGILRTAYKYLSPRRRDLAESLFRRHGLEEEVRQAIRWIELGSWLSERARHLRERIHDDDWLFSRFNIYEEHHGLHIP